MELKELSIATFNLYNFNLPRKAMYTDVNGWSDEEYELKVQWIGQQLKRLNADIIGLQELWNEQALAAVLDRAELSNDYDLLAPPGHNGRQIVCAALVRKGLLQGSPEWIADFPETFLLQAGGDDEQTPEIQVGIAGFSRPVLHFAVQPRADEAPIQVFVCHFKSKGPSKVFKEPWFRDDEDRYKLHQVNLGAALSTIRRTAEASALRFMLTELMKQTETPVIVLGDLNDSQHSNTLNILTEQPRYLVGHTAGGSDTGLYTAQTLQEFRDTRDVYYTHVHQNMRESLDHILVSEQFYDHSRKRLWLFDGMLINNDHLNTDTHKTDGTGDHGIIRAQFKYRPAKQRD